MSTAIEAYVRYVHIYKIIAKEWRRKLWKCFGCIKDENDIDLVNFVACKICKNVHEYNKNSVSNQKNEWIVQMLGEIRLYSLVKYCGLKVLKFNTLLVE